jgi:hypothetical protein
MQYEKDHVLIYNYLAMVKSTLEYGCLIWDPYANKDIDKLENIQKRAARFIKHDYLMSVLNWMSSEGLELFTVCRSIIFDVSNPSYCLAFLFLLPI